MKVFSKKNIYFITAIFASLSLGLISTSFASKLPETKVKVVGTWANLSVFKEREKPFWTETIVNASNGAIKSDVTSFTEMGIKGGEVFRLMEKGVIQFGSTVLGYVAGDDPENEAVDLAGFSSDIFTARRVADEFKPTLTKLYEKKYGIKLLALYPFHAQIMYCKDPITGLDDLKGKKIRTFSKTLSEFVAAVGGTGINIPFGEVVPSLQRGLADCAITGALSGNLAKWHEVTDYLYELPVGWAMVMHGVNLEAWNNFDPEVRNLMKNEIAKFENESWSAAANETQEGINCNTGKACTHGVSASMKLVKVSSADRKRLDAIMREVIVPKWAERCGKECVAQWNKSVGEAVGITAQ